MPNLPSVKPHINEILSYIDSDGQWRPVGIRWTAQSVADLLGLRKGQVASVKSNFKRGCYSDRKQNTGNTAD